MLEWRIEVMISIFSLSNLEGAETGRKEEKMVELRKTSELFLSLRRAY